MNLCVVQAGLELTQHFLSLLTAEMTDALTPGLCAQANTTKFLNINSLRLLKLLGQTNCAFVLACGFVLLLHHLVPVSSATGLAEALTVTHRKGEKCLRRVQTTCNSLRVTPSPFSYLLCHCPY